MFGVAGVDGSRRETSVGERRPDEEEIYSTVSQVYRALGHPERAFYHWYPGDHDYPPPARQAAVDWFRRWFAGGRLEQ